MEIFFMNLDTWKLHLRFCGTIWGLSRPVARVRWGGREAHKLFLKRCFSRIYTHGNYFPVFRTFSPDRRFSRASLGLWRWIAGVVVG